MPEVKTISAGSSGARSAGSTGGSPSSSSSVATATSSIVIVSIPPGTSPRACSSPIASTGLAAAILVSRSLRRSWVLQGSAIAPIRQQASIASTHSSLLPTSVITTSSRWTPRVAIAPERPPLIAISSPKCQTRRSPSGEIVTRAGRAAGKRSSTSPMKFTAGSVPQAEPG